MSTHDTVELRYFGECSAYRGVDVMHFRTRRTAALLAYVACSDTPVSRSRLAYLFWPDHEERQALANLRVLLSYLRHQVPAVVRIERDSVCLDPTANDRVDVRRFQRAAIDGLTLQRMSGEGGLDLLRTALGEYHGELLVGLAAKVSASFEEWLHSERDRLRALMVQVLETLIDSEIDAPTSATLALAERLVSLDEFGDGAQRRLLMTRVGLGDRAVALVRFDDWVERFTAEFGLGPSAGITELADSLRCGVLPRDRIRPRLDLAVPPRRSIVDVTG